MKEYTAQNRKVYYVVENESNEYELTIKLDHVRRFINKNIYYLRNISILSN
jgi:hypothetical protein